MLVAQRKIQSVMKPLTVNIWFSATQVAHLVLFSVLVSIAPCNVDYLQSGAIRLAVIEPLSNGEECKHNGGKACVVFSAWAKRSQN